MFKKSGSTLSSSGTDKIARLFSRYGWAGFWLQIVLVVFSSIVAIYVLFFSHSAEFQRQGVDFNEYTALLGFLILLFTTFWFYRYTRLAGKIADPQRRPSKSSVIRTLWIGVWASFLGIVFSMVAMFLEVGNILLIFLRAPQGGVSVVQTNFDPSTWLSAIDMAGLLADISVVGGEVIVLSFSLWLLLRVSNVANHDWSQNESLD